MALPEFLKEPAPAPAAAPDAKPVDPAAKLRKQVFLEFGAMVALGLLLAGWYVAYRIASGRSATHAVEPAKITFVQAPVVPAPKPAPPKTVTQPPAVSIPAAPAQVESKAAPLVTQVVTKPEPPVTQAVTKPAPLPPAPVVHETKPAPLPAPVVVEPKPEKRKESIAQQPFKRRDLSPRAGEKYWQIAAYGPRSLDAYLKTLEQQGMHPFVGPGPSENIYRILIGPLPNAEALEQSRHLIQSLGIEPILRAY